MNEKLIRTFHLQLLTNPTAFASYILYTPQVIKRIETRSTSILSTVYMLQQVTLVRGTNDAYT